MRKFFTTLKSVVSALVIAAMAFSVSCSYDDTAIVDRVQKVENDLKALTERVANLESKLQTEVDALKALIDGKVVIVDVITGEDGTTVIKLSDGKTITVVNECKYVACDHECTPCDCDNLKYRVTDGVLEVSADGETWIAVNPEENPCDCDNLLYRVTDGVLEVSADGETWVAINGVAADQVVVDVVLNDDGTATIKLATGEEFTTLRAELIECEAARNGLYVLPGETKEVALAVNDAVVDINIMNQPFGWSATVEEAPEAPEAPEVGDDDGIAAMPLAAGGKNYVVKINGPAVTLKEAAKEGVVSVHFNTAAGACKVLSIDVYLAELTLSVDGAGNITITNSVVETTSHPMMGPRTDFADFHIGIVDAADYATYGDHVFAETFDDMEYEYTANVASTKRSSGFFNVIDEPMFYEEGVCEKETYTLTVDQLAGAFWPTYTFELGKEYIIFVTSESEMIDGMEHPILTNALKGDYKRVSVVAKILEDTITWNDATAEFNLAGFDLFVVGWVPVAELQGVVANGMASDIDSALGTYVKGNGIMNSGAIIPATNETLKLSELAGRSMTNWAPALYADTEYKFFVYAFNGMTEMEIYMHQFNAANLYNFGTFSTAALKLSDFDAEATFEIVTLEEKNVDIKATFGEDVVTVAYAWSEVSYLDPEEAAKFILGNVYTEYVTFDEETTYIEASKYEYYGIPENYYLCVLAINADGEYVYVEQKVEKPVLPATDVKALSAKAYYNSDNSYCTIVDFTLENEEVATVAFRTGDGGWDSDACFNHGFNYINIGDWYDWSNKGESEVWYTNAYLDGSSAVVEGAIVVDYNADGYSFTFRINDYNVTYVGAVEGLVAPENYQAGEPEEPTYDYDITFTKCENLTGNDLTFTNDAGYKWVMALTNPLAEGVLKDEAGNWDGNSTTILVPGAAYPGYCYSGTFTVTKDGDNYAISFITNPWINGVQSNCRFTFNGPVEAPSSSGPDLTGYEEGTGAFVDYKSAYGTVRFKLTYEDEVVLQIYPFFGNESEVHFTVGTSQVETLTLAGLNAESGKVDLYQQTDGRYLVMVDATFQMIGAYKFYFYVTL